MKKRRVLISVLICMLLLTMVPISATAATKKMSVTSNRVTEIHNGDSFKFTTSKWSLTKPEFTIVYDSCVRGSEVKAEIIINQGKKGEQKFTYDATSLANKQFTIKKFPRKTATYTVKVIVKNATISKDKVTFTAKHTKLQGTGSFKR